MTQQVLRIIRRWFWLLILAPAAAGIAAYNSNQNQPIFHEARALLVVGPALNTASPELNDLRAAGQLLETYSAVAMSRPFLEMVLASPEVSRQNPGRLQDRTDLVANKDAQTLSIRIRDRDPEQAVIMTNVMARMMVELSPSSVQGLTSDTATDLQTQIDILRTSLENSENTITQLEEEYDRAVLAEQRLRYLDQISQERSRITATVRALAALYESMDQPVTNQIRIIEPAVDAKRIEPDTQTRVIMSGLGGLIIALALIFAVEYFDDTVRMPKDLTEFEPVPVLGAISERKIPAFRPDSKQKKPDEVRTKIAISDAQRMLGFGLRTLSRGHGLQTVLLVGTPGTRSIGLSVLRVAASIAQMGTKVVLIDADPHDPVITQYLGLTGEAGLTDPVGEQSFTKTPLPEIPDLRVVPAGNDMANGTEIYWPDQLIQLIDQYKQEADLIIVSVSSPASYIESLAIGTSMDGTVLVASQGATRRRAVRQRLEQAASLGIPVIGLVALQERRRGILPKRLSTRPAAKKTALAPVTSWVGQPQDARP